MRIPFTKYEIGLTKRGINVVDNKTGLPVSFDAWVNKFSISKRTPILENIYDTIASEFSKIDLILSRDTYNELPDGQKEHIYTKLTDNPNYDVLALRPNMLQTKSELLYTIAYQLHMYRNALVRIVRDKDAERNTVLALEPINCEDYMFGQGYEIGGGLYLKLKDKKTNKVLLLDYNDIIHLRLNPNDIFYGDKNSKFDLNHFVRLFDENLNVLLNELKDAGTVNGVIEIGSPIGGTFGATLMKNGEKVNRQQEIIDRIKATKEGVLVLDSGEKWHSLARTFRTMSSEEVDGLMKYLYNFKGINQAVIDGTATEAQMQVFFNKSVMPIIIRLLEELNYKFLTQTARTQGQRIEHFRNPFEYMATKDMLSNLYLGAMFFTQNEVRHMGFKLSPLPGGDALIDNKNFIKGVKAIATPLETGTEGSEGTGGTKNS